MSSVIYSVLISTMMKSPDFIVGYQWLKDNGFSDKDVVYIKKSYDKEGVKFCKKSLFAEDLSELKDELKIINEKNSRKFYMSLLGSVKGVNIEKALKQIVGH